MEIMKSSTLPEKLSLHPWKSMLGRMMFPFGPRPISRCYRQPPHLWCKPDLSGLWRSVFFVHRIQQIAKKLNTKHSRYIIGIGKRRHILIVFFSVWKWGKTACQKIAFPCEAWYVSWSCSVSWFTTSRCHDCLGDTLTLHVLAVLNLFDRMVEVRCDCC